MCQVSYNHNLLSFVCESCIDNSYFFKYNKFLRNLDAGDNLTEHEKNHIIAKKVGFIMPEAYIPPPKK
jgi:hypothetical protein